MIELLWALLSRLLSDNNCPFPPFSMPVFGRRRTPFDSPDVSSRAGEYSESVVWRVRPLRLLIGIIGIGAISLFASMYARRIQVSFSLRSAKAVTPQQLRDLVYGPMGHRASLFQGAFYVGSDDSSDYVAIKHGRFAVYAYKTPRGDTPIERRMKVTADVGKWVDLTGYFPVVSDDRPNPDEATPARTPRSHVRNCDFSQYHPLRPDSDWIWRGGILKRVEPNYPVEAKRRHLSGKISVRVLIKGNGEVEQACGDGPALLRDAAENAALQWVFRTPELNGEKVPYIVATLLFDFVLDAPSSSSANR